MIAPYSGESIRIPEAPARLQSNFAMLWKLAAAAVVVVAGVWGVNHQSAVTPAHKTASVPAAVVASVPATVPSSAEPIKANPAESATTPAQKQVASLSLVGNTLDLSDADLEQLVADLDGIETLPAAEPQSVTAALDDSGLDQ